MLLTDEEYYLSHYGVIRRSGRYPWGSGLDENTHNRNLLQEIEYLKKQGMSDVEIAKGFKMSTTEYRAERSNARSQQKAAQITQAQELKDKGMSVNAIAKRMDMPEPTVRNLLKPGAMDKAMATQKTAEALKADVDAKWLVDVGRGAENLMKVTSTKLANALAIIKSWGYEVETVPIRRGSSGYQTKTKVLALPGTTWGEIVKNQHNIQTVSHYSDDHGRSYSGPVKPLVVAPKRVDVRYKGEGGEKEDGVIHVRRGVKDVSLGNNNYAQVRIQVGKNHYLKGMAIYKDDLPDGIDLVFNTSKERTAHKTDAMKELEAEPLPFGSIVRQIWDKPGDPKAKVTSAMNLVNEEGNWEDWSVTLSSQVLSKQSPKLAKTQLDMTHERRQREFEELKALTNATVRKKLLNDFADSTAAASVHLKAAALPQQSVAVLLPVPGLPSTQVYAPRYNNGDRVVLIRHPHGGKFEIPELIVNNRNAAARKLLGTESKPGIGINHEVAKRLSGADFDGDTVLVIPNFHGLIKHEPALEQLKNFDPHYAYPEVPGMKVMKNTQLEMGSISNLITDMSLRNASHNELARAVKHSMVVIDAEKHKLNYKLSENENGIKDLKQKYQKAYSGGMGASTLISRAKSDLRVPQREPRPYREGGPVDLETGELRYKETGKLSYKTGKPVLTKTTKLAEAKDAYELSSGTPMENLYAAHSNRLKTLANQARLESVKTPRPKYNASAKEVYREEVDTLNAQLALARANAPLERQAQRIANSMVRAIKNTDPNMDEDTEKKVRYQAQEEARARMGVKKTEIKITQKQWDAIQAGAVSDSNLTDILKHADMERVRELATPKTQQMMSTAMINRAKAMAATGYTRAEIAEGLGVSVSTLDRATAE